MKITAVEVELIDTRAEPSFSWRSGLPGSEPKTVAGVLRIETDEGAVGRAHTRRGVIVQDLVNRRIRGELLGADPLQREWLWHRIWELDRIEEFPIYALGLVDIALWDLAGIVLDSPVHELLGGFRSHIPAYASTVTYRNESEYLDVATQCLERGFRAIKLHAWGDARRDAALCAAVRDRVGPDIALMYDGSAGFDLSDSVYLGRALEELEYTWLEEPMREAGVEAYRRLADRVGVPLLVGETSDGSHLNAADFVVSGCAGFLRTSAVFKGGITGAMRIAHLADAFQLRAEVHGMGRVHQHLCMAIPNTTYYEALVWGNPIETTPDIDSRALLHAPHEPGIGWGTPADDRPYA